MYAFFLVKKALAYTSKTNNVTSKSNILAIIILENSNRQDFQLRKNGCDCLFPGKSELFVYEELNRKKHVIMLSRGCCGAEIQFLREKHVRFDCSIFTISTLYALLPRVCSIITPNP